MLDFLGVTEHFSCVENTPFSFPALFRDMMGEAVSLDGVIFSGSIVSANHEVVGISIEKGNAANEVILSFPALPEGRWAYNVLVQADDGSQRILFSGCISVLGISRVEQLAGDAPMKNRTLLVAMHGEATTRIRMEWLANTAAQAFATHALESSKAAHTDATTASNAATTATTAATTATERAGEANGYAGSAYASKEAAGNSAAAAATSASNAARDAKTAGDAKTEVTQLASSFPQTVSNAEQTISAAKDTAVQAVQTKQADAVLAVGRASKTATDNVTAAQGVAVTAVQTAQTEAVTAVQTAETSATGAITPLVEQVAGDAAASNTAATDATTARTQAQEALRLANEAATAAQQALAAIPQVDTDGNMTLTGSLTAPTATINGVFKVINTGTGVADINYIYGVTWLVDQVELRRGGIVRDDVWCETGVIRIGSRAALSATGHVSVTTLTASQCINANGGINIPLPPVRSGDAVNLGNLPMMEFAPTQQIHVTKSAWEIRGTCNDTAQGLAFNFLNPGEFVGACARVMQWSDSQSYSTIMTTVILTDWFGGNVLVDLAYSNNNISITPISSSDTPFLEQAIQLSIFESQDGDNITGRIINSDGEATSFSAPYKFSHSCVIRIFLLETGSTLRVYLGRFTSGMVDGEETALTLPLLLGEVPIKTGIKRACWLGIGGIRSAEPSDITGRLPVINSVNRYYGKWLNNLFQ